MTAFSSFAYYSFEREIWRQFGTRIAAGEFDLVHRITPLSPDASEHHRQATVETQCSVRHWPTQRRRTMAQGFHGPATR